MRASAVAPLSCLVDYASCWQQMRKATASRLAIAALDLQEPQNTFLCRTTYADP
jgi:hypothetical protein